MKDQSQGYINWVANLNKKKQAILKELPQCESKLFVGTNQDLVNHLRNLTNLLTKLRESCEPTVPNWVGILYSSANDVCNEPDSVSFRKKLFDDIKDYTLAISNHNWELGGIDADFDFEAIYKKYKSESKIDELFDEIISILEQLLTDENVEDKDKKIQVLISIVRNNKKKSCYADEAIITALYNFLIETSCLFLGIPTVAPLIRSLIEVLKNLVVSYDNVKTKTNEEIKQITNIKLEPLRLYDKNGMVKEIEDKTGIKVNFSA